METRLEGNMPDIPMGAAVTIDDYTENYKRTAPGMIDFNSFFPKSTQMHDEWLAIAHES